MTFPEWSFVVGAVLSVAIAAGPWMFKVHAKLAVIASKIDDLCQKLERTQDEHRRLWEAAGRHESQLVTHEVQLAHVAERLRGE